MGCLCSSKYELQGREIIRCTSFPLNKDLFDFSNTLCSSIRSFYAEYKIHSASIGSGLLGEVRICIQKSSQKTFAVKIIPKSALTASDLKNKTIETQVRIMQSVSHPSILKIHDFFEDLNNFYLVMDYLPGGDLFSKMERYGKFSEKAAAKVMKQVFHALSHLHSKEIVHRDVKTENLLVEEKFGRISVKLIDFDTVAKLNNEKMLEGTQGTVYYMAPEVISGVYNEKCDIWSAGIVLYSILTQNFPFGGKTDDEIMKNILKGKVAFEPNCKVSKELLDFLDKVCCKDPNSRISAQQALNHPWILKHTHMNKLNKRFDLHKNDFMTGLKYALRMWAVKNIVGSEDIVDWHLAFIHFDKNADGVICKEELIEALESEEAIERIMELADWNGNGVLEYFEFMSFFVNGETILKYSEEIVGMLDKDNSGQISLSALVSFLEYSLEGVLDRNCVVSQFDSKSLTNSEILSLLDD